ncbi:MAG: ABC transporter substrate-binding protein [Methylocella sp.]
MPIKLLVALCFIMFSSFCLSIGLMSPGVAKGPMRSTPQIKDMSGRDIGVTVPAQRVAILAPVLSAYAAIDEGLGHVNSVARVIQKAESRGVFGHIFPQLASLPIAGLIGTIPDPELTLLLRPDALVAWRGQSETLRKIGYPGLVELENSSLQNLVDVWAFLGKLAGHQTESTRLWQSAETRQRDLQKALPLNEKTAKVLPMGQMAGGWFIGGKNYYLNVLLEQVNAVNPAGDLLFYGATNPEEILRLDPDFIVMPAFTDEAAPKRLYDDPLWQALPSVRQRRVYLMPVNLIFNVPVDETLLLTWLAEVLHPSLPPMTRAAYREIYAQVYHYDLSDEEIDDALFLKENAGSAGYDRFARSQYGNSTDPDHAAPDRH